MPIAVECPSCGKRYKLRDDLAGDTVPCKDCGEDIDVPGGRRGGGGSRGRRKGKSSGGGNSGLVIGGAVGGVVVLAVVGFLMFGRGGGALPAPPGAVGQAPGGFAPGGTPPSVAANPNAAPGAAAGQPKSGSRFDQPIAAAGPAGGAPKAPALTGPKNPNLGVGLGNFVGVTKHWRTATSGQRDPNAEFKTLQESPDQLPPDFWSVSVDPPPVPIVFEPKKKIVKVKVPIGAGNRRSTTEDIIYPVVPSQFVAVGTNAQKKDNREIWNLGTGEKVGTITGLGVETFDGALSPDGKYFAARAGRNGTTISVYNIEEKKALGDLEAERLLGGFTTVAIPKPNMVVAINSFGNGTAYVWELPGGTKLRDIPLGWNRTPVVFSPGGRYMAQSRREHSSEEIWIHELETGDVAGKLSMPSYDIGWGLSVEGIAFSPDGKELAANVNGWSCAKVLIWNVADGALVDHMTFPKKLKEFVPNAPREATPLTWFPGNKRLLAFEHAIVDRDMGTVIWQIPKSSVDFGGKRWALDESHVTVLDVSGNTGSVLVYELPEEKIKASAERLAKTATTKKEEFPQVLGEQPAAVAADFSGLKFLIPKDVPWGVSADPAPASKTSTRPIPLATGGGTVREVAVSRGDSPRAVSMRSNARDPFGRVANGNIAPTQLTQHRWHSVQNKVDDENSFSTQGSGKERAWVDVYDLTSGKKTLEIKMKQDGDLMGLSPDGSRFLCWAATKSGRLDLYSADDGKPIVGWNPYSTEGGGDAQTLVSATLIDATRALTLNAAGRLIVWQLPEVKAVLAIDNASQPAVSPTGKYLSYSDGLAYYFVDLATGELRGRIADVGEVNAAAYHPSGEKLALLAAHKGAYYLFEVNLKTGNASAPFPVPVLSGFLHWCGDRYVLLDNQRLVDIPQRVVAWTYELPAGDHLPTSPDGRHWFLADQGGKPTLTAAKLPNASAEAELAGATLQPEFLLQPGGKCSLNIQLANLGDGAYSSEIEKLMRDQLAKHKIAVEPGQPVTLALTATEKQGETIKQTFSAFGRLGGEEISLTMKTMDCRAVFDAAGGSGWDNSAKFGNQTFFLRREKDQTIEQAIQANYLNSVKGYFRSIILPPYVFTPKSAYGVGKTPLGSGPSS